MRASYPELTPEELALDHCEERAAIRQFDGRQNLPTTPPTCNFCGGADWLVAMTLEDGRKAHVRCAPSTPIWTNPNTTKDTTT